MSGVRLAAVLGGTGRFGLELAWRLALGGAAVRIGSRSARRAEEAAARLMARGPSPLEISGAANREAAAAAEPVFLAVPFAGQEALLEELAPILDGRLVICCGVIWPPGARPNTSAAEETERVLRRAGVRRLRVAAAFQTVAAAVLAEPPPSPRGGQISEPDAAPHPPKGKPPDVPDVLVFADREADREEAAAAAGRTGLRAVPAGALARSRAAEAALGILLDLNRGPAQHAGFRVTGLDR